jgi:GTPase
MFVDRVEVEVTGGKGGDGCMSFRRERFVPKGGPDGGNGGDGGNIIIEANEGVDSLVALAHRKQWRAKPGTHGSGSNRHGKQGEDEVIHVPPGTIVIDSENGFIMKDLSQNKQQFIVARGGKGGKGNTHFKSANNQAPRHWTPGAKGESRRVIFELKSIADVGLIGKPNAGKSTLLSRLSKAKPEIANYEFTTKFPNLGRVSINVDRSFVMADIPGLIEGAHQGIGLGHDFLKHIERAGILVHLVEPEPMNGSEPLQNYRIIREELRQYREELASRPEIIVISKSEIPRAAEVQKQFEQEGLNALSISAATGENLPKLIHKIAELLDQKALEVSHG